MDNPFPFEWIMPEKVPLSSHSQTILDNSRFDPYWNTGFAEYGNSSSFDASSVQVEVFSASEVELFDNSGNLSSRAENYGNVLDTQPVSTGSGLEGLQESLPQATPDSWPQNFYDGDSNAPWSALSLQETDYISMPFQDLGLGPDAQLNYQHFIAPMPSTPDLNIGMSLPHQQYQLAGSDFGVLDSHYVSGSSFGTPALERQHGIQRGRQKELPDNTTSGVFSDTKSWPASSYQNQSLDFGTPATCNNISLPGSQEPLHELPCRRRGGTPLGRRQSEEAQLTRSQTVSSYEVVPLPIAPLPKKQGLKKQGLQLYCLWPNCSYREAFGRDYELCRHTMIHVPGNKRPCLLCPPDVQAKKVYSRKDNVHDHCQRKHKNIPRTAPVRVFMQSKEYFPKITSRRSRSKAAPVSSADKFHRLLNES